MSNAVCIGVCIHCTVAQMKHYTVSNHASKIMIQGVTNLAVSSSSVHGRVGIYSTPLFRQLHK